jgi:hypothetical protein
MAKQKRTMRYIGASMPRTVPEGRIVVHNHVTARLQPDEMEWGLTKYAPWRPLVLGGLRAWTDVKAPRHVECDCGWAPHLGKHYGIKFRT